MSIEAKINSDDISDVKSAKSARLVALNERVESVHENMNVMNSRVNDMSMQMTNMNVKINDRITNMQTNMNLNTYDMNNNMNDMNTKISDLKGDVAQILALLSKQSQPTAGLASVPPQATYAASSQPFVTATESTRAPVDIPRSIMLPASQPRIGQNTSTVQGHGSGPERSDEDTQEAMRRLREELINSDGVPRRPARRVETGQRPPARLSVMQAQLNQSQSYEVLPAQYAVARPVEPGKICVLEAGHICDIFTQIDQYITDNKTYCSAAALITPAVLTQVVGFKHNVYKETTSSIKAMSNDELYVRMAEFLVPTSAAHFMHLFAKAVPLSINLPAKFVFSNASLLDFITLATEYRVKFERVYEFLAMFTERLPLADLTEDTGLIWAWQRAFPKVWFQSYHKGLCSLLGTKKFDTITEYIKQFFVQLWKEERATRDHIDADIRNASANEDRLVSAPQSVTVADQHRSFARASISNVEEEPHDQPASSVQNVESPQAVPSVAELSQITTALVQTLQGLNDAIAKSVPVHVPAPAAPAPAPQYNTGSESASSMWTPMYPPPPPPPPIYQQPYSPYYQHQVSAVAPYHWAPAASPDPFAPHDDYVVAQVSQGPDMEPAFIRVCRKLFKPPHICDKGEAHCKYSHKQEDLEAYAANMHQAAINSPYFNPSKAASRPPAQDTRSYRPTPPAQTSYGPRRDHPQQQHRLHAVYGETYNASRDE